MTTFTAPGQFFFSSMSHSLYDFLIYRFVAPYIWGCKTESVLDSYYHNLSDNHLEIGVGTGFLLDRSNPSKNHLRLSLMDLNKRCLEKSVARLERYSPGDYQRNIMHPLKLNNKRFSSIALNFVLHCVPGNFNPDDPQYKGNAFQNIHQALESGGVFFGATVLADGVGRTFVAKVAMKILNTFNIFHNQHDHLKELQCAMESCFDVVEYELLGSVVLWRARKA